MCYSLCSVYSKRITKHSFLCPSVDSVNCPLIKLSYCRQVHLLTFILQQRKGIMCCLEDSLVFALLLPWMCCTKLHLYSLLMYCRCTYDRLSWHTGNRNGKTFFNTTLKINIMYLSLPQSELKKQLILIRRRKLAVESNVPTYCAQVQVQNKRSYLELPFNECDCVSARGAHRWVKVSLPVTLGGHS